MQVPIYDLLRKFNGQQIQEDITGVGRRKLRILKLPRYLLLSITRFTKNRFFVEKNPTIVNFPARNLNLKGSIADLPAPENGSSKPPIFAYNLLVSVSHVGDRRPEGVYKVFVHRAAENSWYEVQDLMIQETQPEAVVITEAYFQVYEQHKRGSKAGS
jgi:U4/U6.U5 tri-snRNP-associated protein 2